MKAKAGRGRSGFGLSSGVKNLLLRKDLLNGWKLRTSIGRGRSGFGLRRRQSSRVENLFNIRVFGTHSALKSVCCGDIQKMWNIITRPSENTYKRQRESEEKVEIVEGEKEYNIGLLQPSVATGETKKEESGDHRGIEEV